MLNYSEVLITNIERERNGLDYIYPNEDKELLNKLLDEINHYAGTDYHYLAELDAFNIPGAGNIIVKYITEFSSEGVKGYLIPQLVSDRIKDCDVLIFQLYMGFKFSEKYISKPGEPAPAHIYVRYDDAFRKLKPKRLAKNLMELAHSPRDAFYLPFTMRMLASWKMPEMKNLLLFYCTKDSFSAYDVGIYDDKQIYFPSLEFMKRELIFTAIDGLKYYPSSDVKNIITIMAASKDKDIKSAAERTLNLLSKYELR